MKEHIETFLYPFSIFFYIVSQLSIEKNYRLLIKNYTIPSSNERTAGANTVVIDFASFTKRHRFKFRKRYLKKKYQN